jgi:branched-chain amino acid transport system permease protein
MRGNPRTWLLVSIVLAVGLSIYARDITSSIRGGSYYLGIVIDIGINIILAVSLNLINGHTGQFSLGHAGFMAVGGYVAAKLSLLYLATVPPGFQPLFFAAALLLGGGVAALVGLAVGVPSCGFAETISPSSRWDSARSSGSFSRRATSSGPRQGWSESPG